MQECDVEEWADLVHAARLVEEEVVLAATSTAPDTAEKCKALAFESKVADVASLTALVLASPRARGPLAFRRFLVVLVYSCVLSLGLIAP